MIKIVLKNDKGFTVLVHSWSMSWKMLSQATLTTTPLCFANNFFSAVLWYGLFGTLGRHNINKIERPPPKVPSDYRSYNCMLHFYLDILICWMQWQLLVRGSNTMNSYIYFGSFTGKTGTTTSYNTLLVEVFWWRLSCSSVCKPVGGAIYWY